MNINYFVNERLGLQRMNEAMREADHARLVRMAESSHDQDPDRSSFRGRVMPDAAGAREVPSL
ncbi:MAG TPA: hypothetical protein VI007_06485 [bacterium]